MNLPLRCTHLQLSSFRIDKGRALLRMPCRGPIINAFLALLLAGISIPAFAQTTYLPYAFPTFAGLSGISGTNDATGSAARFHGPWGMAVDSAGNTYVADSANHTIRKITASGVVSTLAGLPGVSGTNDGTGSLAQFNQPRGVAVDGDGNVYVADTFNDTIRKITPGGVVGTVAGAATISGSTNGTGSDARFALPEGVAVDRSNNLYVADSGNFIIRKIAPGGMASTFAGSAGQIGTNDGVGSAARFFFPEAIAVDAAGAVFVADSSNFTIRRISPLGLVSTLAGLAGVSGSADGIGDAARFAYPQAIAVDSAGFVYVGDSGNNTIRRIATWGGVATLGGVPGITGNGTGSGSLAQFYLPRGLAVDNTGKLFVADYGNEIIRKGAPPAGLAIAILPPGPIVLIAPQNGISFRATVAGTSRLPRSFLWCKDSANGNRDEVIFTDPTSSSSSVNFREAGDYILSVSVSDGAFNATASVNVRVELNPDGAFDLPSITNLFRGATNNNPLKFLTYGGGFGVFPNTNDASTADAYYAAIDPLGDKDTFPKWKAQNGFPAGDLPTATNGAIVSAPYFNTLDLGFGRRMIMVTNNGNPAFAVSNYKNVNDAVSGQGLIATVAMEYSPGTNGLKFTKFYVFAADEHRVNAADLDRAGEKFVPGLCIVCHGGKNVTRTNVYPNAGNVGAHFLPFDLRAFDYSCDPHFSKSALQSEFKELNRGVRDIERSIAQNSPDALRPAITNLIEGWYGGSDLPATTQNEDFVPEGWKDPNASGRLSIAAQQYLYQNVVAASCRGCHLTRAPSFLGPLDFARFEHFEAWKASIQFAVFGGNDLRTTKVTVNDGGPGYGSSPRMPQAWRTFERFWNSVSPAGSEPEILRQYLLGMLITISAEKTGNNFQISFTTAQGTSYRVQRTDDLPPHWQQVSGAIPGTGGIVQFADPIIANSNRFYRVVPSLP